MEIHKPRPIHNWREFLKEYGIIVLGVLTALGLEQAVETYHEHQRLEESTQAIDAEIREGLASAQIMADMQSCQQQQLAVLSEAVGKGDRARVIQVLAQADIFKIVPFNDAAWTSALASDVSNNFDQRRRNYYPRVFYVTENEKTLTSDYLRSEARLNAFARSGLSQSSSASAAAVAEVAEMTSILSRMQGGAKAYRDFASHGLGMKAAKQDVGIVGKKGSTVAQCNAAAAAMAGGI